MGIICNNKEFEILESLRQSLLEASDLIKIAEDALYRMQGAERFCRSAEGYLLRAESGRLSTLMSVIERKINERFEEFDQLVEEKEVSQDEVLL